MKFFPTKHEDEKIIQGWINNDPDHIGKTSSDFFTQRERAECSMLWDAEGPLMAIKLEKALRVHIQFDCEGRLRTAKGLIEGFNFLVDKARECGYNQVIFESKSQNLINFCKKRFGFVESGNELVRQL